MASVKSNSGRTVVHVEYEKNGATVVIAERDGRTLWRQTLNREEVGPDGSYPESYKLGK